MTRVLVAVLMGLLMVGPAWGQMGNLKNKIKNQLEGAQEERNQQVQNAENGAPAVAEKSGWITQVAADATKVRLYVAHPHVEANTEPKLPALLVIQEWWGVNDEMVQRTEDFAAKGYYAVAVDLYDGKTTKDPKEAAELKAKLTDTAAMVRMKAGLGYLSGRAERKVVDPQRVGAIGWCMGGELALKLAVNDPRVKAVAIFYGPLITDPAKLKGLKGPVLGVFGNEDKNPSPADVTKFEAALKEDKVPVEILRYDKAGHAFASVSAKGLGMYREEQAKDAWEKTWKWLERHVKGK